jgi:hypothetical protein
MAIKVRVLSHIYQILLGCAIYKPPSSLKAYFEIELGPLDFNMVSESPLGCWADLPPIMVHVFGWSATRGGTY